MNVRSTNTLLAGLLGALLATTPAHANFIINGDFEGGTTGGVPNGWNFDDDGDTNASVSLDSSTVGESAFTAATQSARLSNDTDGDGSAGAQSFYQTFGPVDGQLQLVFDFYLDDSSPNDTHWNAQLRGDGNSAQAFAYNIDLDNKTEPFGQFTLVARGGDGAQDIVLDSQTWYRVTTDLDTDAQTFSGTIEDTSGLVATISSKTFEQTVNAFDRLRIKDGASGSSSDSASPINLDNVELVPEPASLALIGFGGLLMLPRRRVRRGA